MGAGLALTVPSSCPHRTLGLARHPVVEARMRSRDWYVVTPGDHLAIRSSKRRMAGADGGHCHQRQARGPGADRPAGPTASAWIPIARGSTTRFPARGVARRRLEYRAQSRV